jgi:hypothetical protein
MKRILILLIGFSSQLDVFCRERDKVATKNGGEKKENGEGRFRFYKQVTLAGFQRKK